MGKKVEVFTAGCPLREETVKLVEKTACPSCDVTAYDLKEKGLEKAREYGMSWVPTEVVDGKILDRCKRGNPTEEDLRAAGIGQPV